MTRTSIVIPPGTMFSDLRLSRDPQTGNVRFDVQAVRKVCAASNLPPELFFDAPEDDLAGLIVAWYAEARTRGEPPDLVAEDLFAEVRAEDALGFGISHKAGSA